jgi:hypothetical protein
MGRLFMHQQLDDPFTKADKLLDKLSDEVDVIIVDWHAEASSEKKALGWYLDGRVTAVLGTHTHIPTADLRILPKGTAYVSDVGMVGAYDSIIGAEKELILKRFLTQIPQPIIPAEGKAEVNAVLIETGTKGKAKKIERLTEILG